MCTLSTLPVPDGFEERIREPGTNVLHGFLAEVMIDSEDGILGEGMMQRRVERTCRFEVAPERLLDDDTGVGGTTGPRQVLDDHREGARRNGEIDVVPHAAPV